MLKKAITLTLLFSSQNVLSCSFGFSFKYDPIPEGFQTKEPQHLITHYLDKQYGKGKWLPADGRFSIKSPFVAENPGTVHVTFGSESDSSIGQYRQMILMASRTIKAFDGNQYTSALMPGVFYIDKNKNSKKAFRLEDITYDASIIKSFTSYNIGINTFPYNRTRLNVGKGGHYKFFLILIPRDKSQPVRVVLQNKNTRAYPLCTFQYFVKGKWPKSLRKKYSYE